MYFNMKQLIDLDKFNQVIATGIAVGVGLHVIPHLTCDFPRLLHSTDEEYEPMKRFFGHHPRDYEWFVRGTEGWTGITMLVLMAIAFTLANPMFRQNRLQLPKMIKRLTGYNAFWYSHHLFIIVYVLLIIHGTFVYLSKEWYHKTVSTFSQHFYPFLSEQLHFFLLIKLIVLA